VRRQLIVMSAAVTAMVLIATLIPMGALIQRFAVEDALASAGLEVQATESVVALRERADLVSFVEDLNRAADGNRTTVFFADGDVIGPDREVTSGVRLARETGRAVSDDTADGAEILVPVTVRGQEGDAEESPEMVPTEVSVIRVVIVGGRLTQDVLVAWAVVALLGLGLLAIAVLVADRLGRVLVRPMTALADTAERLERGDLTARAAPAGPSEVRDVGHALNRLAARISELLAAERESVADASHRLRTPMTALRLEADELRDPAERDRVTGAVTTLAAAVDGLVREARRPVREGVGASGDLAAVVAERAAFWAPLAEDQQRRVRLAVPDHPVPVKAPTEDLAAAVDVLFDNVFTHTGEGVAFDVVVAAAPEGGGSLMVADRGTGFSAHVDVLERGVSGTGSSGLGLDIVRRTAEAAGGRLQLGVSPGGGARVLTTFGPPAEMNGRRTQA
jgi:signal transduction histidine kinase